MRKHLKYLQWTSQGAELFSTCAKAKYMAVVVDRFGVVVTTGYNGVPAGFTHCEDGGCPRSSTTEQGGSYENCLAIHAEANALLRTSRQECEGATLYVNGLPCWDCAKLIIGSGIKTVVCARGRKPVDEWKIRNLFVTGSVDLLEL